MADPWFTDVDIDVDGHTIQFKLNTRSEGNMMPAQIYNQICATPPTPSRCAHITISEHRILSEGETDLPVGDNGIHFQVVCGCQAILEKHACVQLRLLTRLDNLSVCATVDQQDETQEHQTTATKMFFRGCTMIQIDNTVPSVIIGICACYLVSKWWVIYSYKRGTG